MFRKNTNIIVLTDKVHLGLSEIWLWLSSTVDNQDVTEDFQLKFKEFNTNFVSTVKENRHFYTRPPQLTEKEIYG